MAKLYQASSGIANFQKATFSFWFRIPTSAQATAAAPASNAISGTPGQYRGGIELLTFGTHSESDFFHDSYSSINLSLGDSGNGWASQPGQVGRNDDTAWTMAAWMSAGNAHGGNGTIGQFAIDYDAPNLGYLVNGVAENRETYVYGHTAYLNLTFSYDQWHHAMIAVDLSEADVFGNFPELDGSSNHTVYQNNHGITRSRKLEIYFDTVRKVGVYTSTADLLANFSPSGLSSFEAGGWNISPDSSVRSALINAVELSLPTFTGINYNPTIDYADFQAWFGQYIDPATQMSKFVSGRKPVNPATAAKAFGKQTILFKGNHSTFKTNAGSGGAFTSSGGISDFTPGP